MPTTITVRINFGAPGWLAQLVKRPTLGFRLRVVRWSPCMGLCTGRGACFTIALFLSLCPSLQECPLTCMLAGSLK